MERRPIDIEAFTVNAYRLFEVEWLLLTSGDITRQEFNAMTISWGSLGVMWNRPFVQVVVRPVRYTYEFMERFDTFTLCAFPQQYHRALSLLGTKSGRDGDKIVQAGLTPCAGRIAAAPVYREAKLAIECRKLYWQDMDPAHFLDPQLNQHYPQKDYHRIYYGEIIAVDGTDEYRA